MNIFNLANFAYLYGYLEGHQPDFCDAGLVFDMEPAPLLPDTGCLKDQIPQYVRDCFKGNVDTAIFNIKYRCPREFKNIRFNRMKRMMQE